MDLNKLKTGKEFICYWFEGVNAEAVVCKWDDESFWFKHCGNWEYIYEEEKFFKHTTIVTE